MRSDLDVFVHIQAAMKVDLFQTCCLFLVPTRGIACVGVEAQVYHVRDHHHLLQLRGRRCGSLWGNGSTIVSAQETARE